MTAKRFWFSFAVLAFNISTGAEELIVTPDRADGVYAVGERVRWRVQWRGNGAPLDRNPRKRNQWAKGDGAPVQVNAASRPWYDLGRMLLRAVVGAGDVA